MSADNIQMSRENMFRVRSVFVLVFLAFLIAGIVPPLVAGKPVLERIMLILVSIAVGASWILLLLRDEENKGWRSWLSLITAAYLTASIPAVFFELSQWKSLRHPAASIYIRPWVHWGPALMCLGVLGSFCAQGRVRAALVVGSALLLALRLSTGTWVY